MDYTPHSSVLGITQALIVTTNSFLKKYVEILVTYEYENLKKSNKLKLLSVKAIEEKVKQYIGYFNKNI